MLQMRSHFGTVMADDGGRKIDFFCFMLVNMASRRPSTEWGLSPVEIRFIIIQFIVVLANTLRQFGLYNVYKDDAIGLDLVQDGGPNNGVKLHKILAKHSLILCVIGVNLSIGCKIILQIGPNFNTDFSCNYFQHLYICFIHKYSTYTPYTPLYIVIIHCNKPFCLSFAV